MRKQKQRDTLRETTREEQILRDNEKKWCRENSMEEHDQEKDAEQMERRAGQ